MYPQTQPYKSIIDNYAKKFNVPASVIESVIIQESDGNPNAWNGSNNENSRGLMQISEATALDMGITRSELEDLYDPQFNIFYGAKHLAERRDIMQPYFDKNINEHDKWMIITSTYNQGQTWWVNALDALMRSGENQSWETAREKILSLPIPQATRNHVDMYGPQVLSRVYDLGLDVGSATKMNTLLYIAVGGGVILLATLVYLYLDNEGRNE
jgi:membrane-bound lytic murein transglycosylase MltF